MAKLGCAREWGGWGRLSDDGPGQHNPDRSEGPWGRAGGSARTEVPNRASSLTQSREYTVKAVGTKDEGKPGFLGKALSDIPALKPYWGNPAVRNFRGGDGNVGIIRSPVRAIALPDYGKGVAIRSASSLALGIARYTAKRRQRIGGVGIQLRKDAIQTPTPLKCAEGNMNRRDSASSCSVRRSRRPQTRLETSCTRTGRPRRHLRLNQVAGRRGKGRRPKAPAR